MILDGNTLKAGRNGCLTNSKNMGQSKWILTMPNNHNVQ